jgi:hypothetical protein
MSIHLASSIPAARPQASSLPAPAIDTLVTSSYTGVSSRIERQDTLVSMQEKPLYTTALKAPKKTPLIFSLSMAALGMVAGYAISTLKKMDLVGKLALSLGGAIIFYSISLLPNIISRLKNSNERFWAAVDLGSWGLTIVQKVLSLVSFIPKVTSTATRLLAFSIANSTLSFLTFILSAITSARTLLAVYDIKHLHELKPLNPESLSRFICERHRLRWVVEEYTLKRSSDLNRLIETNPEKAARWIKKVVKGAMVFSSLSALSQTLGASAVIIGFAGGGIVGVPLLIASTTLFFISWLAQNITTRFWLKELPKQI